MSNYYVSTAGDDTTGDGLSPATAWASIGKAVGSSPAITLSGTGDTLYIAPGIYRGNVVLGLSPTGGGRLTIQGDPTGAAFGVAPGVVDWRAWTDDLTPTANPCLSATGKSFVTLAGVKMLGGKTVNNSCVLNVGGTDWTLQDCQFLPFPGFFAVFQQASGTGPTICNLLVDRCSFVTDGRGLLINPNRAATEYDMNVVVRNCLFIGGSGVYVQDGGSGVAMPTGIRMQSCTGMFTRLLVLAYSNINITTPSTVYGCTCLYAGNNGANLQSANNTQMTEDGNIILSALPRTNVAIGADSIVQAVFAVDFGDGRLTGLPMRPFGEPTPGSPMIAFGNYGTTPTVDINDQARPTTAAAGAYEIDTIPGGNTYIFQVEV